MELRATIRNGKVTLVPMEQVIVEGGAAAVLARAAIEPEVSLADVSWEDESDSDDREVGVEFLANDSIGARRALKRWAVNVGHRRLWLPDEVFEPKELPPARPVARTSCRCCGLEMSDRSPEFWEMVREGGLFPPFCFTCGATVPQWTVPVPGPVPSSSRRMRRLRTMREAAGNGEARVDEDGSEPDVA